MSDVSCLIVTACGGHAEGAAGAGEQVGAGGLEVGAALDLGLDRAEAVQHGVDVAGADGAALLEDERRAGGARSAICASRWARTSRARPASAADGRARSRLAPSGELLGEADAAAGHERLGERVGEQVCCRRRCRRGLAARPGWRSRRASW